MSTGTDTSRSSGRQVVSQTERGISGPVAAAVAFVIAAVGAAIDVVTGDGLRTIFAVFLVAAVVVGIVIVRRRQVFYLVFAPPLICVALALLSVLTTSHSAKGLTLDYLAHGFPAIATATGVALVFAVIRLLTR